MRKFYYEYDEIDLTWDVYESDGAQEHGAFFDTLLFCIATEQDAIDAIKFLMELES